MKPFGYDSFDLRELASSAEIVCGRPFTVTSDAIYPEDRRTFPRFLPAGWAVLPNQELISRNKFVLEEQPRRRCFADTTSGTGVPDGYLKVPVPIGVFKFPELARGCADPKVMSLR
jgi:hypothetical protein